jgi:hypothetical protein
MPGERKLRRRGEDAKFAAMWVVHEHRLREAEVGGHALPPALRHCPAVEEHAERVAARPVFADKDL